MWAIVLGKMTFTTRIKYYKILRMLSKALRSTKVTLIRLEQSINRYEEVTGTWASDILGTTIKFPDHAHRYEHLEWVLVLMPLYLLILMLL